MKALIYDNSNILTVTPNLLEYLFSEKTMVRLLFETSVFLDTLQKPESLIEGAIDDKPVDQDTIYSVVRGIGYIKERLNNIIGPEKTVELTNRIDELIKESNETE